MGFGVKHEAVQHCGGVVQSIWARILPIVAKTPNFSLAYVRPAHCAHVVPALCQAPGGVGTMGHTPTPSRFGATFTAGGGGWVGGGGGGGRGPARGGGGLQTPTYMV